MRIDSIKIAFSVLLAIGHVQFLHADNGNTTSKKRTLVATVTAQENSPNPTPPKPQILLKDSDLCKKCSCDVTALQIDCSNKSMTTLFSDDEWSILENGDVFFDVINLQNNDISSVPELPAYPVKTLLLSFNKIDNIKVGAFRNLSQLTVLDLSNNNLTSKSLIPGVFEGPYASDSYEPLRNLKTLNLSNNAMHTLKSNVFEHLPNLETLNLCRNMFQVVDTPTTIALSSLYSLKTLDLSYMEINDLPKTLFNSLSELETLILTGNLFKTLPVALISTRYLKCLVLDENPLKDFENDHVFKSLNKLEYLSISFLQDLTKIGPWVFSDLQNLNTLVATNNRHLASIHELAFSKNTTNPDIFEYPPLQKLFLENNNLTTIERNWIGHWEKITIVDLRLNPWTCDCTNSWLIHSLLKQINNTTPNLTKDIVCATPLDWKDKPLLELNENRNELLCENINACKDGTSLIWIGILVGMLINIPLAFVGIICYRKNFFDLLNRQNAVAGRSLYNRASFADEFHI